MQSVLSLCLQHYEGLSIVTTCSVGVVLIKTGDLAVFNEIGTCIFTHKVIAKQLYVLFISKCKQGDGRREQENTQVSI